jgi:hypothetical protein
MANGVSIFGNAWKCFDPGISSNSNGMSVKGSTEKLPDKETEEPGLVLHTVLKSKKR